jgi:hypothetical protein
VGKDEFKFYYVEKNTLIGKDKHRLFILKKLMRIKGGFYLDKAYNKYKIDNVYSVNNETRKLSVSLYRAMLKRVNKQK